MFYTPRRALRLPLNNTTALKSDPTCYYNPLVVSITARPATRDPVGHSGTSDSADHRTKASSEESSTVVFIATHTVDVDGDLAPAAADVDRQTSSALVRDRTGTRRSMATTNVDAIAAPSDRTAVDVAAGAGLSTRLITDIPTQDTQQQQTRRVVVAGDEQPTPDVDANDASTRVRSANNTTSDASQTPVAMESGVTYDVDTSEIFSEPAVDWHSQCALFPSTMLDEQLAFEQRIRLDTLTQEAGALVLCESDFASIVLTPAEETWADVALRYANQVGPQWVPYLPVPPTNYAYSPYGPTTPAGEVDERPEPITVFSPSRFAAFVASAAQQTPAQALFTQRHMAKAVVLNACIAGASVREYYDHPVIQERLDGLYVYAWTDPAACALEAWRRCCLVSIHESERPFSVPHIVVSHSLPNAPWDCEIGRVPMQQEEMLVVPCWYYGPGTPDDEEIIERYDDDFEDDEELRLVEISTPLSESETASEDEIRTPSPPPLEDTFPEPTRLETLAEEDEDEAEDVPVAREVRCRQPWLEEEDDKYTFVPPIPTKRVAVRIVFRCALPTISETPEPDFVPPMLECLWRRRALSTEEYFSEIEEAEADDADGEESEEEAEYGFGSGYRPQEIPRPSCDIFINEEDSPVSSPTEDVPPTRTSVVPGKVDWFDLPEDDLPPLEWG